MLQILSSTKQKSPKDSQQVCSGFIPVHALPFLAAPEQSGLHQRRPPPAQSGTASQADSATPEFNPEQEAKCRSILRSKDYYKILGVDKTCSSEEVKKSYRKVCCYFASIVHVVFQLALQFHPDKAKCPSAEAAFKELSKAYQCLSDSEARKHYDIYGISFRRICRFISTLYNIVYITSIGSEVDAPQQQQQYRQNYESHFMSPEVRNHYTFFVTQKSC